VKYLDSDEPADPYTINELAGIMAALKFYKRESVVSRLIATLAYVLEIEH
jgi:hypothetical protein